MENICLNCANWIDPTQLPSKELWWRNSDGQFFGACVVQIHMMHDCPSTTGSTYTCTKFYPLKELS